MSHLLIIQAFVVSSNTVPGVTWHLYEYVFLTIIIAVVILTGSSITRNSPAESHSNAVINSIYNIHFFVFFF